jgi:D-alanyl-D-alanine carboxypeptidase
MAHDPELTQALAHALNPALSRSLVASRAPGAQAAVLRGGEVVWTGSAGVRDLATDSPVDETTVFCLASLGKTIVAALTLRCVEEGRLDLDAPLSAVVADDVPGSSTVTTRMLLTHTSGYPDLYQSPELLAVMPPEQSVAGSGTAYDPDRPYTWDALVAGIRPPVEPGARWDYSNTGYVVLTEVLGRLLGGDHGVSAAWFAMAGAAGAALPLTQDLLTMERSTVSPDRLAHGHEDVDGAMVDAYAAHRPTGVPSDLFGLPFGDGLFGGTALGYALFLDALLVRRTLLEPATLALMTAVSPQAAVADVAQPDLRSYGMGTYRHSTGGRLWQGHSGGYGGFSCLAGCDVHDGTTLVVLTNAWAEPRPASTIWETLVGRLSLTAGDAGG